MRRQTSFNMTTFEKVEDERQKASSPAGVHQGDSQAKLTGARLFCQ